MVCTCPSPTPSNRVLTEEKREIDQKCLMGMWKVKVCKAKIKWGLFLEEQTFIENQGGSNFKDQQNQVVEKTFTKETRMA